VSAVEDEYQFGPGEMAFSDAVGSNSPRNQYHTTSLFNTEAVINRHFNVVLLP